MFVVMLFSFMIHQNTSAHSFTSLVIQPANQHLHVQFHVTRLQKNMWRHYQDPTTINSAMQLVSFNGEGVRPDLAFSIEELARKLNATTQNVANPDLKHHYGHNTLQNSISTGCVHTQLTDSSWEKIVKKRAVQPHVLLFHYLIE